MLPGRVIVLDVGKTLAKLSLWDESGRCIQQCQRYNGCIESGGAGGSIPRELSGGCSTR